VVLSELLDQIDRTFLTDDGEPARRRVVVEHRLQPWSAAYFETSETPSVPRSFDRAQCRAAEALRRSGDPVPPFVPGALGPQVEPEPVTLTVEDLVRFWCHPAKAFCRHLGLALQDAASGGTGEEDAEPFTVGGLEGFAVRQWLLERRLAGRGEALSEERDLLRARGLLPPGRLGTTAWQDLTRRVDEFLQRIPDQPRLAPADVDVRGGDETAGRRWRLGGRIDHRTTVGLLHYRCGAVRPDDLIRSWIEVLALAATGSASGSGSGARLLGEDRAVLFEAPLHPLTHLDALVDGFAQGLRRPLPVAAETSQAWAEQERVAADPRRGTVKLPREAARQVFAGRFVPGPGRDAPEPEADDPYVRQCFRDLTLPDQPDAGHWAKRLWWPIFDHARDAS
jgi:exodeoxyribonuclease V gamma subunit